MLIFAVSFSTPFRLSYASGTVLQVKCINIATVGNFNPQGLTFTNPTTAGNVIVVGVGIQGVSTSVINNVNVSDSLNAGMYTQQIRATDQGNGLYVGLFTEPITVTGTPTVTVVFKNTPNNSQNLHFCIYEVSNISATPTQTSMQEGGGVNYTTVSTGDLIFSDVGANGNGGTWATSGTLDSTVNTAVAIGHTSFSFMFWGGITAPTYSEEADMSFVGIGPVTSTVISTVTGWNVFGAQTPFNWFLMALMLTGFPAGVWTVMRWFGPSSSNIVWITLLGLFVGAIMGTIVGFNAAQPFVPMGITIFYGSAIVLYIIKARGRGDTVTT